MNFRTSFLIQDAVNPGSSRWPSKGMRFGVEHIVVQADEVWRREYEVEVLERFR